MFKAPYLSKDALRRQAADFLQTHNEGREVPVPIEWIVESRFNIDIVPMPGMQDHFDVVAFLTKDLKEIRIDEYVYRRVPTRYRFSLAHELAHRILHSDVWQAISFEDIESWKAFVTDPISDKEYSYLEFHANFFAGLALVPSPELRERFRECVAKASEAGLDVNDEAAGVRDHIESYLGRQFEVSSEVVHRRLEADSLWSELP